MSIFVLLIAFQLKHFIADYLLQTKSMLGKFSKDWKVWIPALYDHVRVHGLLTFLVVLCYTHDLKVSFGMGSIDMISHFFIDRLKASPNLLGRWKPDNKYFWWVLGLDQYLHFMVHYFVIYLLLR